MANVMRPATWGSYRIWAFKAVLRNALLLALLQAHASPAAAETRALVVGINDYKWITHLQGAVGDALDISDVLRRRGVKDLKVFEDQSPVRATRAAILEALEGLIARTQPGDLVIISFAGHGNSEVWRAQHPPDVKTGDAYEVFLLRDFLPPNAEGTLPPEARKGYSERIAGREMRGIFERLERKGARTIFVADACHGGGLTRKQVRGDAEPPSYRFHPYPPLPLDDDPIAQVIAKLPAQFAHLKTIPSLTFLAAVNSTMRSPEVDIPRGTQTKRGALSYAFARMLEGGGDADQNGVLSRAEMFSFTNTTVKEYADFQQTPELQPSGDSADISQKIVIDFKRDFGVSVSLPLTIPKQSTVRTVHVFVEGSPRTFDMKGRTSNFTITSTKKLAEADLIWRPDLRQVISKRGDLVASDVDEGRMAAVAEREVALRELMAFREGQARPEVRLVQGDKLYCAAERVKAVVTNVPSGFDYFALFNIAGDGAVQFLAPRTDLGDNPTLPADKTLLTTTVVPPFGADTIVLIVDKNPMEALIKGLRVLDGERVPLEAVNQVRRLASDAQVTYQAIFTAPKQLNESETTACGAR